MVRKTAEAIGFAFVLWDFQHARKPGELYIHTPALLIPPYLNLCYVQSGLNPDKLYIHTPVLLTPTASQLCIVPVYPGRLQNLRIALCFTRLCY